MPGPADIKEVVVTLPGDTKTIRLGERVQATAEVFGENQAVVEGLTVFWSTSGFSERASVDANGLVTAKDVGDVEVTASVGSKVGKVFFTIVG